jgi:hypothetical protein
VTTPSGVVRPLTPVPGSSVLALKELSERKTAEP